MIMQPLELEPSTGFEAVADRRPRMEEPLPVRLIAVADVRLHAMYGQEHLLDPFYAQLLEFVKEGDGQNLIYRGDNFSIHFDWHEGLIDRNSLRPVGIEVESLGILVRKLVEREIEFQFERGLTPGSPCVLMHDPAGNALQVYERRHIG